MDKALEVCKPRQIPTFASFRPKEGSVTHHDPTETLRRDPSRGDSRIKSSKHQVRSSKGHKKYLWDEQSKALRAQSTLTTPSSSSIVKAQLHGDVYVLDKAGDPRNLAFGTLDRYATPIYSRIGAGNIIGSDPTLKIDRTLSDGKGLVLSAPNALGQRDIHPLRHFDQGKCEEYRVKKVAGSEHGKGQAEDYVPLGSHLVTRAELGFDDTIRSLSRSDPEWSSPDPHSGQALPSDQQCDSDLELIGDAGSSIEERPATFDSSFQKRRMDLTRRIDAQPHSAESWLELVKLYGESLGPRPTRAERQSIAEVKISLYEKALHTVDNSKGRHRLLVELMEEALNVWDYEKLSARWNQILKADPDSMDLWICFLDFQQTSSNSFVFEATQNVFLNCLMILQESVLGREMNESKREKIYANQVYVILRLTFYMRECGFSEHATAAWQALLEFEFCSPPTFSRPHDDCDEAIRQSRLTIFEEFWESEIARIGEDGARGWANSTESRGQPPERGTRPTSQVNLGDPDLLSTWILMERTQQFESRQPARTSDETIETDPYRIILFSDIRPFLIVSPSKNGRSVLLDAFLIFCQLPLFGEDNTGSACYRQGYFRSEALYLDHNLSLERARQLLAKSVVATEPLHANNSKRVPFELTSSDVQIDSEVLFANPMTWFSAFDTWWDARKTAQNPISPTWVLNALRILLTSDLVDGQWAEYILALELCLSPNTVRRTAKNLLKKQITNLRLYNAYAMTEFRSGNTVKGANVLIAAINMSRDLESAIKHDGILLWRTWIWHLLNEKTSDEAFARLQTYGDSVVELMPERPPGRCPPNPTNLLRTEKALTSFRDHMIFIRCPENAVLAMDCLILFVYLKDTTSLAAATAAYTANLHVLSRHFTECRISEVSLRQSFARLLYHHATHEHLFKPSEIRLLLAENMTRYPRNTIFLSLYIWNESRFRLDDRVRSMIQEVVLGINNRDHGGTDNVESHLFAIHAEETREVGLGSNDNAIRAAYERAVSSRCGQHCAGIWKKYFFFECSRQDLKKATAVFHRGITACPWVKELYLLPFQHLRHGPGAMREADLRGLYNLMVDKELRVHIDLEALLEQRVQ